MRRSRRGHAVTKLASEPRLRSAPEVSRESLCRGLLRPVERAGLCAGEKMMGLQGESQRAKFCGAVMFGVFFFSERWILECGVIVVEVGFLVRVSCDDVDFEDVGAPDFERERFLIGFQEVYMSGRRDTRRCIYKF